MRNWIGHRAWPCNWHFDCGTTIDRGINDAVLGSFLRGGRRRRVRARSQGGRAHPRLPEPVVQWGVQKGETCDDIAKALYGSA